MRSTVLHPDRDLASLVRRTGGGLPVAVPVPSPRSVKDAVESVGIPHTEVGAVVVDGVEVGWGARLAGGEHVVLHTVGRVPSPLAGLVAPAPPVRPVRFVADVHLGTLARRLRVLGFDTAWRNDTDDRELVDRSEADRRVLLTRDRGLLMRRRVVHGALVRADAPDEQLEQVVARFDLAGQVEPGSRCPRCNDVVVAVTRDEVVDELEPGTRAAGYERFGRCRRCRQLYWAGAHADALAAIVTSAAGDAPIPWRDGRADGRTRE